MASKRDINETASVEEFILSLPRDEQLIVKKLRALVQECLPRVQEKLSFGVPYYTHHRMICFIWPPSAPWSAKIKNAPPERRTSFGFCQGNRMSNEDGVLLAEGRKQVYCMYFTSLQQINDEQIRALLYEAEMIDEGFAKAKKRKRG